MVTRAGCQRVDHTAVLGCPQDRRCGRTVLTVGVHKRRRRSFARTAMTKPDRARA
jgi:hypothetical protein